MYTTKFLLLVLLSFVFAPANSTIYVSLASTATQPTGSSWNTAFQSLQDALAIARAGDTIYVAQGTYKPTTTTNRSISFNITDGIRMYGGFDGNEQSSNRPSPLASTYLDGDIGVEGYDLDNSYHVITTTGYSVIDGFIIRNGYANDNSTQSNGCGGGMYTISYTGTLSSVVFENNTAYRGGAIYGFETGLATLSGSTFQYNKVINYDYYGGEGGGIYVSYNSQFNISNTVFINNEAYLRGGAIYSDYAAHVTCTNCTFNNNKCSNGHGGALFVEDRNSQFGATYSIIQQSSFTNNVAAYYGGAICYFNEPTPTITNTMFSNNIANKGAAITLYQVTTTITLTNNVFTNNIATNSSTNNFYNDSFPSTISIPFTCNEGDYMSTLWSQYETYYKDSEPSTSDIIVYCNVGNTGMQKDGRTWSTAYTMLQDALDSATNFTLLGKTVEVWVAQGKYNPSRVPSFDTSPTGPQDYSFILAPNVALYGGFSGTETSRSSRNWYSYLTYLSGNLSDVNCEQIMIASEKVRVDGFIFTGARGEVLSSSRRRRLSSATSYEDVISSTSRNNGGGLYSNGTNIYVYNSLFIDNWAEKGGGAYCIGYNVDGTIHVPYFTNVAFACNGGHERGGGISGDAYCNFVCERCIIENSVSDAKGGGVYLDYYSSPSFSKSKINSNIAWESGGGLACDGGGYVLLNDTVVSNNYAKSEGGGLYLGSFNPDNSVPQTIELTNVTLSGNSVGYGHVNLFLWNKDVGTFHDSSTTTTSSKKKNSFSSNLASGNFHAAEYAFIIIMILIGLGLIFGIGYYFYNRKKNSNTTNNNVAASSELA